VTSGGQAAERSYNVNQGGKGRCRNRSSFAFSGRPDPALLGRIPIESEPADQHQRGAHGRRFSFGRLTGSMSTKARCCAASPASCDRGPAVPDQAARRTRRDAYGGCHTGRIGRWSCCQLPLACKAY
jgi:hypothetical protein